MTDDLYSGDDSTGLLTHFVGRVRRPFWSTLFAETQGKANQDFAHTTMLFWQNDVLDILQANYSASGPPIESNLTSFGIGNGWYQTADDPALVYHEDDEESDELKRFHSSTAFMKFVHIVSGKNTTYENAIVGDGDGELGPVDLGGVRAVHAQRGVRTLRDARIWENMIFEYRGIGFVSRNNPNPKPRAFPVRFLGVDDSEIPELTYSSSGVGVATSAPGTSAKLGEMPDNVKTALPAERFEAVSKLWASSPTVEAFRKNVAVLLRDEPDAAAEVLNLLSEDGAE